MFDSVPPQAWLLLILVTLGIGPARYVWRYLTHPARPRDIMQPPDDLSWRSEGHFYRSLATSVALVAVGVFIFTPAAESFARSDAFVPSLLGAIGIYALGTTVHGWRNGRIEPLVRGLSRIYEREEQPLRYWVSLGWNAALGCALLAGSAGIVYENKTLRCDNPEDKGLLTDALEACDTLLAQEGLGKESRADLLAARGRIHHELGADSRALADYSAALDLQPNDSYALYNRALIYAQMGDLQYSIEDFDASLALRPDNEEAYLNRGLAYLDTGRPHKAIDDFTAVYERNPDNPYALANRGIAHAWMGNDGLAERDFAKVHPGDPSWPVVLRGRAILAMRRQNYAGVIEHLSQALALDPDDVFALRMRADAYWQTGERDLARDDDDRSMKIEAVHFPKRVISLPN